MVGDLLRKLGRFRHAVVEPSCHGDQRSVARFRALARVGAVSVVFLPQLCVASQFVRVDSTLAVLHLTRHVHWLKALSKVHKSSCRSHPS